MTQRTSLTIRENHIGHANVRHWDICSNIYVYQKNVENIFCL